MIARILANAPRAWSLPTTTLAICWLALAGCSSSLRKPTSPSPSASPTPKPAPLVAFLFEGQVFKVATEALDSKPARVSAAETAIDEFIWSADGKSIYVASGLRLSSVSIESGEARSIGLIEAPDGTTLERLQGSSQPDVVIIHASDANAVPHIYRFGLSTQNTRELTIDEYLELAPFEAPTIRGFSELSVSPDSMRVMYKAATGSNEEIFISEIDTGTRTRLTALAAIDDFEESAEAEGGRRIINASWSPDGRFILFNPAQSCSESGLCYGQLFRVDALTGGTRRLSQGMMIGLEVAWDATGTKLLFEDNGRIFLSTAAGGEPRVIAEGNRPKWQPVP